MHSTQVTVTTIVEELSPAITAEDERVFFGKACIICGCSSSLVDVYVCVVVI
jgi:hypothetical protein